jgi:hypothetical protein
MSQHLRPASTAPRAPDHDERMARLRQAEEAELREWDEAGKRHGQHPAEPAAAPSRAAERTSRVLSPDRKEAQGRAARLFGRALAHSCGHVKLSAQLDVSHRTVGRWADEHDELAVTLRDIVAGPASLRREVGKELVASADDTRPTIPIPLTNHALLMGSALGEFQAELVQAQEDGEISEVERRRLEVALRKLVARAAHAARDAEGAK